MSDTWDTASHDHPCPICEKPDWCGRSGDVIRCMRQSEPPPGWRLVKHCDDGGTVFTREDAKPPTRKPPTPAARQGNGSPDWQEMSNRFVAAMDEDRIKKLAVELDVTVPSLRMIEVGWDKKRRACTFPERDSDDKIIGIGTRARDGSKSFIGGGKRGLIVPRDLKDQADPILIVEGPSDVAACLTLGVTAVGRPSNFGGNNHLPDSLAHREVLIMGENDQKPDGRWPGRDGAETVARRLAGHWHRAVSWALPPDDAKDVRTWLNQRGLDMRDNDTMQQAGCELIEKLQRDATTEQPPELHAPPYRATPDGIIYDKPTTNGDIPTPLTNFIARISAETVRDDGIDEQRLFEIATTFKEKSQRFSVSASHFVGMAWPVENLGIGAVVYAGFGLKEHARVAIQLFSSNALRRTIYTHTGWRKIRGQWAYLHCGGAISADGLMTSLETDLPDSLRHLTLPAPAAGADLHNTAAATLNLLELAPDRVMVPLLGTLFRSVVGPCDFALHLVGETGTFKTELAAIAQQHFGAGFNAKALPGSWSSTGNALEALAFVAKDALFVVDDFAPNGTSRDIAAYHRNAERLIRAQGNRSGRGRCRADGTLRMTRPPRGVVLSTGEDTPKGQSIHARMLVVEVRDGDVTSEPLRHEQSLAARGIFATAMAAYLQWLAGSLDEIQAESRIRIPELRQRATTSGAHRRTPDIVANIALGWQVFLRFSVESGVIDQRRANDLWDRVWSALGEVATAQTAQVAAMDPVPRFFELLGSAISSGRAHLAATDGSAPEDGRAASCGWRQDDRARDPYQRTQWIPLGDRIGWEDGAHVYLDAASAYRLAQSMVGGAGEPIAVREQTLWRLLKNQGLLLGCESNRGTYKVRRKLGDGRKSVLMLEASTLLGEDCPTNPTIMQQELPITDENPVPGSGSGSGLDMAQDETRPCALTAIPQNGTVRPLEAGNGRVGRVNAHVEEQNSPSHSSDDREVTNL